MVQLGFPLERPPDGRGILRNGAIPSYRAIVDKLSDYYIDKNVTLGLFREYEELKIDSDEDWSCSFHRLKILAARAMPSVPEYTIMRKFS